MNPYTVRKITQKDASDNAWEVGCGGKAIITVPSEDVAQDIALILNTARNERVKMVNASFRLQ